MTFVSRDQLDALLKHAGPNSVSIWMPTRRAGRDIRQNRIRMKNLQSQAEQQLVHLGLRPPKAEQRVAPLRQMVDDETFWRHQADGLAVLLGNDRPTALCLPITPSEVVTVGDRFHVKPLFGDLAQDAPFYILQLSEKKVQLLRANRFEAEPVDLPGVPSSFAEFMRADDPERQIQFHTGTAKHQPGGNRPAIFHGQGAAADLRIDKEHLSAYCRRIDAGVVDLLEDDPDLLMLAAAEPLRGLYAQASHYPKLDSRAIEGNPDLASVEDLHRKAVQLLQEDFARPVHAAMQRYFQARESDTASNDLGAILRAASVSAVDTLLIALDEHRWGRFDNPTSEPQQHEDQQAGDQDLLNVAVVLAYGNGATVFAVPRNELPDDSLAVATLRFKPED